MSSDVLDLYDYYGGVEGGGTHSNMVILRSDGQVMASSEGGCTSHYHVGMDECLQRINSMAEEAKKKAGLPVQKTLKALGMALSGVDEPDAVIQIREKIMAWFPSLTETAYVTNDCDGSLATALPSGGVVLIAGTGSNCLLINTDGAAHHCGGLGHIIGDEASAYWIAWKAIKLFFDHEDNLVPLEFDVSEVKSVIFAQFNVSERAGILDHLYTNFDITKIAGMCLELSKVAYVKKDPLCLHVFKEAGKFLSMHIVAVGSRIDQKLLNGSGGLHVVCVGSVWKSWLLLKPGFVEHMKSEGRKVGIQEITLLRLTTTSAIGAASLGARSIGICLPLKFEDNYTLLDTVTL